MTTYDTGRSTFSPRSMSRPANVVLDNLSAHRAPRSSRITDGALDATNRRWDAVHAMRTNCPMNVDGRPARVTAKTEY